MAAPLRDVSAILLAGGQSRRMGRDKRFVTLDGEQLLQRILRVLEPLFPEILLAAAGPAPELSAFGHPVIADLIPGCASLGGIYSGLASVRSPRAFVAACDMPMLNADVIRHLVNLDPAADVVMPRLAVGLQPTHAIYAKTCLPHLEEMARTRQLKVQELLQRALKTRIVEEDELRRLDPALLSFFNVNTPADLEFARKLLAGQTAGSRPRR